MELLGSWQDCERAVLSIKPFLNEQMVGGGGGGKQRCHPIGDDKCPPSTPSDLKWVTNK